jgi:hypothetical protein
MKPLSRTVEAIEFQPDAVFAHVEGIGRSCPYQHLLTIQTDQSRVRCAQRAASKCGSPWCRRDLRQISKSIGYFSAQSARPSISGRDTGRNGPGNATYIRHAERFMKPAANSPSGPNDTSAAAFSSRAEPPAGAAPRAATRRVISS